MTLFKGVTSQGLVEINTNNYSASIASVNAMADVAKQDFPNLTDNDIDVVVFGGQHKKGITGLHFRVPEGNAAPDSYQPIHQREKIL